MYETNLRVNFTRQSSEKVFMVMSSEECYFRDTGLTFFPKFPTQSSLVPFSPLLELRREREAGGEKECGANLVWTLPTLSLLFVV
jgi:hypothetical protein